MNDKSIVNSAAEIICDVESIIDGVPAPVKRGFLKACNQLGTAWLEGKTLEIKATSEARAKVQQSVATKISESGEVPQTYIEHAMEKYAGKIARKRFNLDNILIKARDFLISDKKIVTKNAEEQHQEASPEISSDWLNTFEDIAENMSSEEMQTRFARILAGEIERPSSFSVRTVKLLSEIDTNTANLFARFCGCCIVSKIHVSEGYDILIDVRLVALGGQLGNNCMKNFGFHYTALKQLQEYGLISSDLNSYTDYMSSVVAPNENTVLAPFYYQRSPYAFRQQKENEDQKTRLQLTGVSLTTVGTQLYNIIDLIPNAEHFEAFKEHFLAQNLLIDPVKIS